MVVAGKGGVRAVDVSLIHVSPPDDDGNCSFGVSIGHSLPLALESGLVIAEVNARMPRVLGDCFIHVSRIVGRLPEGSAVTMPRHSVRFVGTEYGIADLWGKSLSERASALIEIAHPDFREGLARDAREFYYMD